MKISMGLMAVLVTLSLVIPYVLFVLAGKKDTKKNKKQVRNIIKKEDLTLNFEEQWNENFIGLDQIKKVLLFYTCSEIKEEAVIVNLNEIIGCKINKTFNNIKKENKIVAELQTLDLELIYSIKKPSLIINFYHVDNYFSENFEQKRADKWVDLIQRNCSQVQIKKAA